VNLIGNGTLALLRDREQLDLWRDRPDLDDNAVEELLRFDSPVQMSRRVTLEDYPVDDGVDGQTIPAGSLVLASLAPANPRASQRDEQAGRTHVQCLRAPGKLARVVERVELELHRLLPQCQRAELGLLRRDRARLLLHQCVEDEYAEHAQAEDETERDRVGGL